MLFLVKSSILHTKSICIDLDIVLRHIIMKSSDPLRANKIFIRKKLGHTAVSAIKASSVTLDLTKGASGKYCKFTILTWQSFQRLI